jgi:nucleotide-binding universal stress UspA family protein
MVYKDILVPVMALERDQAALRSAAALARKFDAKASALVVSVNLGSSYAVKQQPLSAVLEDIALGSRSHAGQERERIEAWLARAPHEFELRNLSIEAAAGEDQVVAHARVSDLVVTARPLLHDPARHALVEDVLFKSGRPVLLVPETWRRESWQTIVVGWNAKAEAVRAVTGALPLLQAARRVIVATVDASPSAAGHSAIPGHEIAAHLARHGVNIEVHNVDGLGRSHAKALTDEAVATDADLMVLGAYGHSRAREFVLGGVTRELLTGSDVPLLMAH